VTGQFLPATPVSVAVSHTRFFATSWSSVEPAAPSVSPAPARPAFPRSLGGRSGRWRVLTAHRSVRTRDRWRFGWRGHLQHGRALRVVGGLRRAKVRSTVTVLRPGIRVFRQHHDLVIESGCAITFAERQHVVQPQRCVNRRDAVDSLMPSLMSACEVEFVVAWIAYSFAVSQPVPS